MAASQRAFAQKLLRQPNADVRRQIASTTLNREGIRTSCGSQINIPLNDVVEPLDFEEFLAQHQDLIERDPIRDLLEFPADDIEVGVVSRKLRTVNLVLPDEKEDELDPWVWACVRLYSCNWLVINRRHQHFSSSLCVREPQLERLALLRTTPKQEYEIDVAEAENRLGGGAVTSVRRRLSNVTAPKRSASFNSRRTAYCSEDDDSSTITDYDSASVAGRSTNGVNTPRGSWASSVFDLRNSQADALLSGLLESRSTDELDARNAMQRAENRNDSIFAFYPHHQPSIIEASDAWDGGSANMIERRLPARVPAEPTSHRMLIKSLALKMELEFEPIFATLAVYDARARKKVSENFYMDANGEHLKRMLNSHVPYHDESTLSRSCIFNITVPTSDLFLVIRLEKVLQGDLNEAVEPYFKDIKDEKNREKAKQNAAIFCERLGRYRQPLAWTAIHLQNVITGGAALDARPETALGTMDSGSSGGGTLSRGAAAVADLIGERAGSATLGRRGSMERKCGSGYNSDKRRSWSAEDLANAFDTFRPVTITVNSFYKEEADKLRDDDLYKFLLDLKRPSSVSRRLKSIPGTLRLDISPCPPDIKYSVTPELAKIAPYPEERTKPPTKDILEFPIRSVHHPWFVYRNILYLYPKSVNFANRPGSARNIACKVQLLHGEDAMMCSLPLIYGKSSCFEFTTEAYTTVNYHDKTPNFHDEIKIKLPAKLTDRHHLFFTFYHISCQQRGIKDSAASSQPIETPIGYTWLPLLPSTDGMPHFGALGGEHNLPIMMESPPPSYSFLSPHVQIPNTKWLDGHRPLFELHIKTVSSVFPQDIHMVRFLNLCNNIERGSLGHPRHSLPLIGCQNETEAEIKTILNGLPRAQSESLVHFLPVTLDYLLRFLVQPPVVQGVVINVAQTVFEVISSIVIQITRLLDDENDQHRRNSLLGTYLQYQCTLPHPPPEGAVACPQTPPTATPLDPPPGGSPRLGRSGNASSSLEGSPPIGGVSVARTQSMPAAQKPAFARCASNPDLLEGNEPVVEHEVRRLMSPPPVPPPPPPVAQLDRSVSMRAPPAQTSPHLRSDLTGFYTASRKLLHEELVIQWLVMSSQHNQASPMHGVSSSFFLELIVKAMQHHLASTGRLHALRRHRFSDQYIDDLGSLITLIAGDICERAVLIGDFTVDRRESAAYDALRYLNQHTAFFLYDLLSLIDRGIAFQLIKIFVKHMSARQSTLTELNVVLQNLKLDFLRIVCSHEHYIPLNLPFAVFPSHSVGPPSPPSSPSPSVTSSLSGSSASNQNTPLATELSTEFRHAHFLAGLVLADLANTLESNNAQLISKAVGLIVNLLSFHDWDPRYRDSGRRARVASLYLPLVTIVLDALPQLYTWADIKGRLSGSTSASPDRNDSPPEVRPLDQSIAMAISGNLLQTRASTTNVKSLVSTSSTSAFFQNDSKTPRRPRLSEDTSRHLLCCLLWVLKNADSRTLRQCWTEWSQNRLKQLMQSLHLCVACFQYKGKSSIRKFTAQTLRRTSDLKSKLEEAILGTSSARSELIRRKAASSASTSGYSSGLGSDVSVSGPGGANVGTAGGDVTQQQQLRWRKDQHRYTSDAGDRSKLEKEQEAHLEGNLAAEAISIVLDTLEHVVQVCAQNDGLQGLLGSALRVLLHSLALPQSTHSLQNIFATQRSFVLKFPELLFEEENAEQCADLCLLLLRHCGSCISQVRSQAAASLYLLMRQNFEIGNNFARVKMQVTMSLSRLVGTSSQHFNEEYLRRSLKTILVYAEEDTELQDTNFPEQVCDLAFNLHMILSDTVKMKEFEEDFEMLMDLMYRIAKGYQNSPDLRLTWLANMAQKHRERGSHMEAAHCFVHSAALVAEYLHMLEHKKYLPIGCVTFEKLSWNILEESAVSEDVLNPNEDGLFGSEGGMSQYFTEWGLIKLLDEAAACFCDAGAWESVGEVYKIVLPIAESHRDHRRMADIFAKLNEAYTKIEQQCGKRMFGTYFRVGFYGEKFGDLDGEEFIYKEPNLTKLPEISHRLENFYCERFGDDKVEMIKDSNQVDPSRLHPDKAYIQITYVEPHFDAYELRDRITHFERNYNIRRFVYSTPFTPDGRPHGELDEQHKRKTILTTAQAFPYVKTRVHVKERRQCVLSPIEVAIEDIQKKTAELAQATWAEPSDPKILQMVLQGCIGTTVNQGPMEMAVVFLADLVDPHRVPTPLQHKLRLCFKEFSKRCGDALRKNRTLIGPDQRDYQKELERNYSHFVERLQPMIRSNATVRGLLATSSSSSAAATPVAPSHGSGAQRGTRGSLSSGTSIGLYRRS